MKPISLLILAGLLLFSCQEKELMQQPKKFITADKMSAILVDFYLAKGYNEDAQKGKRILKSEDKLISPSAYIYKKYHIDSLQFAENMNYYLTQKEAVVTIYANAEKQLEALKKTYTKRKLAVDSLKKMKKHQNFSKETLKIEREIHTENPKN